MTGASQLLHQGSTIYCIGFYDLNNHVYANSAANYMVMVLM